ncbi:MAG: hydrogenase maturation nickel metallochaperone HypA [Clostridia bacterium]|nr:hydrogenase maturation nickel metallochaperone HypA [Clostridia bacterium]
MHELGIVQHVIRTLGDVAEENGVKRIGSVTLEVGEVSGVVIEQLVDCWNYFRERDPLVAGAELLVETIPAVTFCTACKGEYETVRYGKTCPLCGSPETYLLRGNEFSIKQIEAELFSDGEESAEEGQTGETSTGGK